MEKSDSEPLLTNSLVQEETFFPDSPATATQPPKHSRRKQYGFWNRTILTVGTGLYVPIPKAKQHNILHKDQISIAWQKIPTLRRLLFKGLCVRLPGGQVIKLDQKSLEFFVADKREALFEENEEALIWLKIDPEARKLAIAEGWEE